MRKFTIVAWLAAALLAGCGGETITNDSGGTSSSSGASSSGGGTVEAASLTAVSSTTTIPADGTANATITVLARDANNNLISGVGVTFASDSGGLAVTNGTTDTSGSAVAVLSTAGDSSIRTIKVTATSGDLTATVSVQVTAAGASSSDPVASLTLTTSAATIPSDGSTTATISALARDAANNVLAGVPVSFTATSGAIQALSTTTDASGTVTATVSTAGDSSLRTITVTGKTDKLTSTVAVKVVAPSTPTVPVYSMGNGTGTGFVTGVLDLAVNDTTPPGTLAAGGTTSLNLTIVDQTGALYTANPITVTFSSPCLAANTAQILASGSSTPTTTIATSTGVIGATYVAKGCSGNDTVKASATVGGQNISASGTVAIAASSVGSIQFVSATPISIGLKGTGLGETSTVIFKVTDSTGGPKSGVTVNFALNTTVGGLSLSPASQTTASDGTVQTVVSAGTVHTVVRVTASITSPALSTQSSQLTVTTGLPASAAFSIAVGAPTSGSPATLACPNVEGGSIDGIVVPVSVRLADRYNNPVPDGTSVAFTTNGGHIGGACTTPATVTGDGTCIVNWTSANPRPALNSDSPALKGVNRATILATTIGEESFTDVNGSGFWQPGDPFVNLGEPYRDDNENGVYDSGEYFLDFNQNQHRDAGTGSFVGITCTGVTATSSCTTTTLAISASHLIIMSTSNANITLSSETGFGGGTGGLTIAHPNSGSLLFNITDQNGNAMPANTTIAVSYSGTGGSLTQSPANVVVGCDATTSGFNILGSLTTSAAGAGTITVTVTSPSQSVTTLTIPVTIT